MKALTHGPMSLDLPGGWGDRSTLLFVAPDSSGSVSVTFSAAEASGAQSVLDDQLRELRALDPGVKTVGEGEVQCGLGQGRYLEVELTLRDVELRQIVAVVLVDSVAVTAAASAQRGQFDAVAPQLWQIIKSLKVNAR